MIFLDISIIFSRYSMNFDYSPDIDPSSMVIEGQIFLLIWTGHIQLYIIVFVWHELVISHHFRNIVSWVSPANLDTVCYSSFAAEVSITVSAVYHDQGRIQRVLLGGGGGELWQARERKPIWGSGGLPPVGSLGKAPGQGVWGMKSPWSWRVFVISSLNF